ncbi:helix-turn-helix domain-containing protein [Planctomonas sp. JC2975]|uniref:helix-turn-helix transcriptional regulator n=1 Tax=Planctomonas sp. JC2975 TaxID=2729626 RepID=UPI0014748B98|nr:helix-turn-helix transcriptional regulator [Planctomonas sp. JC2975]NNC12488.1 helix-turn-helix domain-containing protein [Planctomonas sp. JC2975]
MLDGAAWQANRAETKLAQAKQAENGRSELGAFLRARRETLSRADAGLPTLGRTRTSGLRREDVSYLSGVSVTWYTWLEQGRDIHPSRQVLDAIARALRLTVAEHDYLLALAGYSPATASAPAPVAIAPPQVQRLMDALAGSPAYTVTADWRIAGWNAAYAALYPGVATAHGEDRNLLWLVFTDPYVRELLPDWEATSRRFVAEFRADAGPRLGDPAYLALVARLEAASPEFRTAWAAHDIEGFASRERMFRHPTAGLLTLEHHQLSPSDHPDLHVVIYTPAPGSDSAARLAQLLSQRRPRVDPAAPTRKDTHGPAALG